MHTILSPWQHLFARYPNSSSLDQLRAPQLETGASLVPRSRLDILWSLEECHCDSQTRTSTEQGAGIGGRKEQKLLVYDRALPRTRNKLLASRVEVNWQFNASGLCLRVVHEPREANGW